MTAFGKANYERYREFNHGVSAVTGEPLPEWDDMPVHIQSGWDASAEAVALVLAECPVDEDAPGNEPAKVIVVTEAPAGKSTPVVRRYPGAVTWIEHIDHVLEIRADDGEDRKGRIATYQPNAWLSVREDGSASSDSYYQQGKKLAIALDALRAIGDRFISDDLDEDLCRVLDKIACGALADIVELDL